MTKKKNTQKKGKKKVNSKAHLEPKGWGSKKGKKNAKKK